MSCRCKKQSDVTLTNTLAFYRSELVLDIENYAFVTGDIMDVPDDLKHQVFDIAQDGNEDLVTRQFNLAYAECTEALYPYSKAPCIQDEKFDNKLVVPQVYETVLTLPSEFSRTTVLLLKELIHDYFVCRVLREWFGVTNPDAKPYWDDRLEKLKAKIKTSLLGRTKPLRRSQSLF